METKRNGINLEVKIVSGLKFRANKRMCYVMKRGSYALYAEGLGYLQWNCDNAVYSLKKKYLQEIVDAGGLLNYDDVHFVYPV